jgi:hypothetical protein
MDYKNSQSESEIKSMGNVKNELGPSFQPDGDSGSGFPATNLIKPNKVI